MQEVYYIIYTVSVHENKKYPSYLQLVNDGRMIQSNLYDASKYKTRENAEKEMKVTSEHFKNREFDIIPIDRRIFGETPRWIED